MSQRKAKEVVKELEALGLLNKERRWGEKGSQSNIYIVVSPMDIPKAGPKESAHDALTPVHDMHPGGAHGAQYKELLYKEPSDKEKGYIDLPIDAHRFIDIYDDHFFDYFFAKHPKISQEQYEFIMDNLDRLEEFNVSEEDFAEAVKDHFATLPETNNGSIIAFIHTFRRRFDIPHTGEPY